jgi:hypothetical protein
MPFDNPGYNVSALKSHNDGLNDIIWFVSPGVLGLRPFQDSSGSAGLVVQMPCKRHGRNPAKLGHSSVSLFSSPCDPPGEHAMRYTPLAVAGVTVALRGSITADIYLHRPRSVAYKTCSTDVTLLSPSLSS